ncbi:CLUMA_CG017481, isoform A [Clunio marinus]|uniref:CLUMA_CG017481, isoform A n=1 Tax=Clunio marinus TaxID=568069 RepID=A0A1J1J0M3_9DIPT|nr:CLUMA_CG017481, isoform A [Clunio marinus]
MSKHSYAGFKLREVHFVCSIFAKARRKFCMVKCLIDMIAGYPIVKIVAFIMTRKLFKIPDNIKVAFTFLQQLKRESIKRFCFNEQLIIGKGNNKVQETE